MRKKRVKIIIIGLFFVFASSLVWAEQDFARTVKLSEQTSLEPEAKIYADFLQSQKISLLKLSAKLEGDNAMLYYQPKANENAMSGSNTVDDISPPTEATNIPNKPPELTEERKPPPPKIQGNIVALNEPDYSSEVTPAYFDPNRWKRNRQLQGIIGALQAVNVFAEIASTYGLKGLSEDTAEELLSYNLDYAQTLKQDLETRLSLEKTISSGSLVTSPTVRDTGNNLGLTIVSTRNQFLAITERLETSTTSLSTASSSTTTKLATKTSTPTLSAPTTSTVTTATTSTKISR